jgi:hypothetical protein
MIKRRPFKKTIKSLALVSSLLVGPTWMGDFSFDCDLEPLSADRSIPSTTLVMGAWFSFDKR